jgi:hypothetical protein
MSIPWSYKFTMRKVNSTLNAMVFMFEERLCWIFESANAVSICSQFGRLDSVIPSQQKMLIKTLFRTQIFLLV